MSQSKRMSAIESFTNLMIGNMVAWLMYAYVLPLLFGVVIGSVKSAAFVLIFNVLSVIRSFLLRRLFERISRRRIT
jgi:hypothetical protein